MWSAIWEKGKYGSRKFEEKGRRSNFDGFMNKKGAETAISEIEGNRSITTEMEGRWEMKQGGVNEILLGKYSCTCNQPYLLIKKNRRVCDKNNEQKVVFWLVGKSTPLELYWQRWEGKSRSTTFRVLSSILLLISKWKTTATIWNNNLKLSEARLTKWHK